MRVKLPWCTITDSIITTLSTAIQSFVCKSENSPAIKKTIYLTYIYLKKEVIQMMDIIWIYWLKKFLLFFSFVTKISILKTNFDNPPRKISPSGLGNDFVCKRFAVQILLWSMEFVILINLEHGIKIFIYNWNCHKIT